MKSQGRRDEDAITIFTGVLLLLVVAAAGAVVIVLADKLVGLDDVVVDIAAYAFLACAVVASIRYVHRHRGR